LISFLLMQLEIILRLKLALLEHWIILIWWESRFLHNQLMRRHLWGCTI
jgi:hypothetical protein